jgi:hypothetical protein
MSPAESTPQTKSTGPRTPEGKAVASHNALRHGLTGRVVVLPTEDMNIYRAFCKELMAELAPGTPLERQYAQTFCDTQWRLNRARSYEDSMLALGHFELAHSIDAEDPQTLAALTAAKVFRENSKAFVNLSLYEQRLQRAQKEALRQLQELQTKRIAMQQVAKVAPKAAAKTEAPPSRPDTDQFVYSTAGIARETSRAVPHETPRPNAEYAAEHNESPLPQAA